MAGDNDTNTAGATKLDLKMHEIQSARLAKNSENEMAEKEIKNEKEQAD